MKNLISDPKNVLLEEEQMDFREFFLKVYKRRRFIFSLTLVFVTFTMLYSFMMRPVYRASARILLESRSPKIVKYEDVAVSDYQDMMLHLASQQEILKSFSVARLAYEMLGGYKPWSGWRGSLRAKGGLPEEKKIQFLLENVSVEPVRNSQVVVIRVEDADPERAARIANLWVDAYISYSLGSRSSVMQYASSWLEKQIEKAKEGLQRSEDALQKYRMDHNVIDVISQQSEDSAVFAQLIQRRAELNVEFAQQLKYFKEKHPVIIGIRSELQSIDERIEDEKQRQLSLKEVAIQYNILKREVETAQAGYESLLNRLRETRSIEGMKLSNVRMVDEAHVPRSPVRPNKKMNLLAALFFGLFIGTGSVFVFEVLDQSVKSPEDIRKGIGLSFLEFIPFYDKIDFSPALMSAKNLYSPVTEAYRSLRTNISLSNPDVRKKAFLITSAGPQEGKTTVAVNLATVFAQTGDKTLLVDVDLRNPRLHKVFGIPSSRGGVTEALGQPREDYHRLIHPTGIPDLDLLICGTLPPNPAELIGSNAMSAFIDKLCAEYDRIIFDTPPVLAVSDAVILSTKVDGTILVVKSEYTHKKAVSRMAELIGSVGSAIIGVVLNMMQQGTEGRYGGYYYYRYSYTGKESPREDKMKSLT